MINWLFAFFIDQGHNPSGPNTGAEGNGLREQDVNFIVGVYLADLLRADPRFEVRLSRNSPDEILGTSNASSLAARVRMANRLACRLFYQHPLQFQVNPASTARGLCFSADTQSYWLAQHVLIGIVERVGTKDNGVRLNPSLFVLRRTSMPAILVELAYLSNAEDAQKLRDDPYGFAQGIYNGLLSYFGFAPL